MSDEKQTEQQPTERATDPARPVEGTVIRRTGCFSPRTMTLNLPENEMLALEALARKKGMSKTATLKQALRLYAYLDEQRQRGRTLYCESDAELTKLLVV